MKLIDFTFKKEALWMVIFSLGLPLIGLIVLLVVWFVRGFASNV